MKTFLEMCNALKYRLQVVDASTLYPTDRIKQEIIDAHQWATSEFNWPEYSKAMLTSTIAGNDYYDYPLDYQTFSITNLVIDTKFYEHKNFQDFLRWRSVQTTVDPDIRYYATYSRWFFVYPTPTATGVNNIDVYGQVKADDLSADSDTTIFSGSNEKGNEAIVLKALSVCVETPAMGDTGKTNKAMNSEVKAKLLLTEIFAKIAGHQQTQQRLDKPLFNVPNFFPGYGFGVVTGNSYYDVNNNS